MKCQTKQHEMSNQKGLGSDLSLKQAKKDLSSVLEDCRTEGVRKD